MMSYWCGYKYDPDCCGERHLIGSGTTVMGMCPTCFDRARQRPKKRVIIINEIEEGQ